MQTIISKALNDMNIKPMPSRRCFTIMCKWFYTAVNTAGVRSKWYCFLASELISASCC